MRSHINVSKYFSSVILISLWLINGFTFAQDESEFVVKGVVRDAKTKQAIAAAQIQSLKYPASATTNEKGEFSIALGGGTDVLQITAFDYNIREFAVRGEEYLEIDLYSDVFNDDYKKIEDVTNTVKNSYNPKSVQGIEDVSSVFALTADDIIKSKLGGNLRSISRSGTEAVGSTLFIRGYNSLNANAQPLFVVDGVIWNSMNDVTSIHGGYFSNPIANIDINDIESITVLKDGTSIYGSKAANGVVLINTKRGRDVVTKINLNATYGITETPSSIPMMNGDDHRIYISEILGTMEGFNARNMENLEFLNDDPSTTFYMPYHNETDWDKEVYQQGQTQNYLINVNGGDDKALYYFSLGYTLSNGVVKTTNLERLNTRFNADFVMSDNFNLGVNVSFSNIDRDLMDDGVNFISSPSYLSKIKAPFLNPNSFTNEGKITLDYEDADIFGIGNPTAILQKSSNISKHYRFNIGAKPEFTFSPSLKISSFFDYSLDKTNEAHYIHEDGMARLVYRVTLNGTDYIDNIVTSQQMRNIGIYNDTRLNYNKKIDNHAFDAILGWRYLNNYYESDYVEGYNSPPNTPLFRGQLDFMSVDGVNNHLKSLSNYINVNYNYDNRFFATLSTAVDGSSRFGSETEGGFQLFGHSWGVFPSINGAWLMSSENFMSSLSAINFFKLRAGYGVTGNDGIEDYVNTSYFLSQRYLGRATGAYLANVANDKIQWETTSRLNVGFDSKLFNERLSLSMDVFSSTTSDLLTLKTAPVVTSKKYYWSNEGELSNFGYEINADLKALNFNAFKWELGLNIGHYKNELTKLPEDEYVTDVYDGYVLSRVGNPVGVFYGYKTNGVFASATEAEDANLSKLESNGSYTSFGAGDMIFVDVADQNGEKDGIIDANDLQIIGDPNPDLYGSFYSIFAVKNVKLSALFNFSYGNEAYNYLRHKLESGNGFNNQTTAMLTRWTTVGQVTNQPRAVFNDPIGNARFSDRWIEDASFLRLKSLTLSYDVPMSGDFISGLNIWFSANNLWTLTDYLGLDPEFSSSNAVLFQGVDAGLLPLTKSYYFGVKLDL